jgi:hypothetical protein
MTRRQKSTAIRDIWPVVTTNSLALGLLWSFSELLSPPVSSRLFILAQTQLTDPFAAQISKYCRSLASEQYNDIILVVTDSLRRLRKFIPEGASLYLETLPRIVGNLWNGFVDIRPENPLCTLTRQQPVSDLFLTVVSCPVEQPNVSIDSLYRKLYFDEILIEFLRPFARMLPKSGLELFEDCFRESYALPAHYEKRFHSELSRLPGGPTVGKVSDNICLWLDVLMQTLKPMTDDLEIGDFSLLPIDEIVKSQNCNQLFGRIDSFPKTIFQFR